MEPGTLINGENGKFAAAGRNIHDHEKMGWMTFAQMVQKSSNVGAAKTGIALGEARLYRYLKAFGFGQQTEIDLPGEATGLVREPKSWGRQSLASIAFGQEIGVTSLQLLGAVAAVANGGWLMKPYVVSEIRNGQGDVVARMGPLVRRRPISAETAQTLTAILEGVVTHGTGGKAAVQGFRVAGKTGTAQKIDPQTGRYSPSLFVASFVGFLPAEDPKLAILVVVDEPHTEQWGGTIAAPVFRKVAEQTLTYLGVSSRSPVKLAMAMTRDGIEQ
jgi:cell division protein FtsI (penicillin-binding protein 3)